MADRPTGPEVVGKVAEVFRPSVEDDGLPFNPLEAPEPDLDSPIETRQIGGLGIHLVRNVTDGLEYRRNEGRNRLVIRKQLPRSE